MGNKGKMKQLIREVEKVGWISTEDGWKAILEKNSLPISPAFLKKEINTFIKKTGNEPKGKSLLWLGRTLKFTMIKEDGTIKPARPEEALERFIVVSNAEVFNQIPVGGSKENVDLGYWENNAKEVFNFVELKAWESGDSPLYAVIESLKNLSLFKIIKTEKLACKDKDTCVLDPDEVKKIKLITLAPSEYFNEYFVPFEFDSKEKKKSKLRKFLSFINDIEKEFNKDEKEFNIHISFKVLEIKQEDFYERCRKRIDENKWKDWKSPKKGVKIGYKQKIKIGKENKIDNLERGKWQKIEKWGDLE